MRSVLPETARKLVQDIETLKSAMASCRASIRQLAAIYPDDHLQISASIELSIWGHYQFDNDWSKFVALARSELDKAEWRSQVWVTGGPHRDEPHPDAVRHLDRINVALHVIASELSMELPISDVRAGGWEPDAHVARLHAFALSLTDVLTSAPATESGAG